MKDRMKNRTKKTILKINLPLRLGVCIAAVIVSAIGSHAMAQTAPSIQAAHTLQGRIWDARAQKFITEDMLYQRAAAARYVLLGEKHDSEAHHARQLDVLKGLAALGHKPVLVMEQFDSEYQTALTQTQTQWNTQWQNAGSTGEPDATKLADARAESLAESLADAGQLNRKGWRWPMYKDLIAFAAQRQWPVVAANLSRADARKIAMGEVVPVLPAPTQEQRTALEDDVVQGHCGHRPEQARLDGIVTAQRARDARMAQALDAASGVGVQLASPVVLIAGASHVRVDRAVPRYLAAPAQALTVAMVEVMPGKAQPEDYDRSGFDVLWFTPRQDRSDACAKPLPGLAAPAAASVAVPAVTPSASSSISSLSSSSTAKP
jgi:uncharacterized iron-regulated protein